MRLFVFFFLFHWIVSCQTLQYVQKENSEIKRDWSELSIEIESESQLYIKFGQMGPVSFRIVEDYPLSLAPDNILMGDLFLPEISDKSPLVMMVHGNKFNKGVHFHQAERLASWGFHVLTVGVPNEGQWLKNGGSIDQLVNLVVSYPPFISSKFDISKIILVGHSFGGSAVTIAAGKNPKVAGIILLDPAVVHNSVKKSMNKVSVPTILLGADPKIFSSRKRKMFFQNIPSSMTEITIVGSTHNDAQIPSITAQTWGVDPFTTREHQETFVRSIIASAFSLSMGNGQKFLGHFFKSLKADGVISELKVKEGK